MPKQKFRQFDFLTIFPEMITSYTSESILGRAQKAGLIKVQSHNLRDYSTDKHHKVDDTPYGGGAGMVMKVEVFDRAVRSVVGARGLSPLRKSHNAHVVLTSASGKQFTQQDAIRLAKYNRIIFLCGRYEGIDARVEENLVDESFSVGPYVLTGGELPALIMMDAIARNIPGVLGSKESLVEESHTEEGQLEYPQYTKPEIYKKWKVPEVLLSGDHKKIEEWRKNQQKKAAM